ATWPHGWQNHMDGLRDGRIAETGRGTTLVGHLERQRELAGPRTGNGDRADHVVVVDLLLAEVLIYFGLAGRQHELAELRLIALCRGFHAGAIQVVPIRYRPDELHLVGPIRQGIEAEGLIRGQEIGLGFLAATAAEGHLNAAGALAELGRRWLDHT